MSPVQKVGKEDNLIDSAILSSDSLFDLIKGIAKIPTPEITKTIMTSIIVKKVLGAFGDWLDMIVL